MEMYLDYEFYKDKYGGEIEENVFKKYNHQAQSILDYYTFNRIKEVDSNIKLTLCELIDETNRYNNSLVDGKAISSEKVGSYSVSYEADGEKSSKDIYKSNQKEIILKRLGLTGLMYRGI